jgi:hypothetical protein
MKLILLVFILFSMSFAVQNMLIRKPKTAKVTKLIPQEADQIKTKEFQNEPEVDKNAFAVNFIKYLNNEDSIHDNQKLENNKKLASMHKNYRKAKNCMVHRKLCKFMVVKHA